MQRRTTALMDVVSSNSASTPLVRRRIVYRPRVAPAIRGATLFKERQMKVRVEIYADVHAMDAGDEPPLHEYTMDHNDPAQRRVLGEQCRNAFSAGQCVVTFPWE